MQRQPQQQPLLLRKQQIRVYRRASSAASTPGDALSATAAAVASEAPAAAVPACATICAPLLAGSEAPEPATAQEDAQSAHAAVSSVIDTVRDSAAGVASASAAEGPPSGWGPFSPALPAPRNFTDGLLGAHKNVGARMGAAHADEQQQQKSEGLLQKLWKKMQHHEGAVFAAERSAASPSVSAEHQVEASPANAASFEAPAAAAHAEARAAPSGPWASEASDAGAAPAETVAVATPKELAGGAPHVPAALAAQIAYEESRRKKHVATGAAASSAGVQVAASELQQQGAPAGQSPRRGANPPGPPESPGGPSAVRSALPRAWTVVAAASRSAIFGAPQAPNRGPFVRQTASRQGEAAQRQPPAEQQAADAPGPLGLQRRDSLASAKQAAQQQQLASSPTCSTGTAERSTDAAFESGLCCSRSAEGHTHRNLRVLDSGWLQRVPLQEMFSPASVSPGRAAAGPANCAAFGNVAESGERVKRLRASEGIHVIQGRPSRSRWSSEETAAFVEAVNLMGAGNWRAIEKAFGQKLGGRTNAQLKDKWQNLVLHGHVTRGAFDGPWALT
ncbi:hypothetical protein cyc_05165 [Cyclospora cayetanensis]|uniref:Uncharacterized protein n=1 Tax=Cyclospora cayetanensis TaxID=88456 RepID=A0A1D3D2C7_9EIME|nr:hypothetical protein cyc_05165 [Cyclospora cayetanensis]